MGLVLLWSDELNRFIKWTKDNNIEMSKHELDTITAILTNNTKAIYPRQCNKSSGLHILIRYYEDTIDK